MKFDGIFYSSYECGQKESCEKDKPIFGSTTTDGKKENYSLRDTIENKHAKACVSFVQSKPMTFVHRNLHCTKKQLCPCGYCWVNKYDRNRESPICYLVSCCTAV